jgi:hypothetical protein
MNPYFPGLESQLSYKKYANSMTQDEYLAWEMAEQQLLSVYSEDQ